MALTVATLTLSSGLEVANPVLILSEINNHNNVTASEKLTIQAGDPVDQQSGSQGTYALQSTSSGGNYCTYMVAVFASKAAFNAGKPAVETLKDSHSSKVFNFDLNDAAYKNMTPREAAYTHLKTDPCMAGATEVSGLNL